MSQTTETKTKTPVERLEEWIAALRSGKYKQGKDSLRAGRNYCCLGVACVLTHPWYLNSEQRQNGDTDLLPDRYAEEFGLNGRDQYDLAGRNDNGDSFSEIADYIESAILPRVRREQEGQ